MRPTPAEIALAYRLFLNREPTEKDAEWVAARCASVGHMRSAFLDSHEFQTRYSRMQAHAEAIQPAVLLHIHIPRAAGTTLGEALARQPGLRPNAIMRGDALAELAAKPASDRRGLRYARGQMALDPGASYPFPYRLLCLIRQPGPRIFSQYQFIRRHRTHHSHAILTERDMSFGDYLQYSLNEMPHRLELDNGQVRRLAGRVDVDGIGQEPLLLRRALHQALSPRMIFGFVEHFDLLAEALVAEGYLPDAALPRLNTSPDADLYDSAVASLDAAQRAIFDSYIAWDQYFYDLCESLILPN